MDHSLIIFPSIVLLFVIPSFIGYIVAVFCCVSFLVVSVVNYKKILVAVRRHHSQLGNSIASQQMSIVIRREKKVALDMWIVAIFLLASFVPILLMTIFELRFPRVHSFCFLGLWQYH